MSDTIFDATSFAEKVFLHRGRKSMREVCSEIGISHATMSRIERGKTPDVETFLRICRWMGRNPAEFVRTTYVALEKIENMILRTLKSDNPWRETDKEKPEEGEWVLGGYQWYQNKNQRYEVVVWMKGDWYQWNFKKGKLVLCMPPSHWVAIDELIAAP